MKTKNTPTSFIWTLPFIAFLSGYIIIRLLFAPPSTTVPVLVGLSLSQAAKVASDNQLSIHIIAEKVDDTLKPEMVISQKPQAHQKAKQHQIVYLVTARQPEPKKTPEVTGKTIAEATKELSKADLSYKIIPLTLQAPSTIIIAQQPEPGKPLVEPIQLYTAQSTQTFILPDFKEKLLVHVQDFLEIHHIPATVQPPLQPNVSYRVEQQKPLAGTIISLDQPPTIQLLVKVV